MKIVIACLALIALTNAFEVPDKIGTQEEIDHINSIQRSWIADTNQFSGMSHDEVKTFYLGLKMHDIEERPSVENLILSSFIDLPDAFDARTKWNLLPIKD